MKKTFNISTIILCLIFLNNAYADDKQPTEKKAKIAVCDSCETEFDEQKTALESFKDSKAETLFLILPKKMTAVKYIVTSKKGESPRMITKEELTKNEEKGIESIFNLKGYLKERLEDNENFEVKE